MCRHKRTQHVSSGLQRRNGVLAGAGRPRQWLCADKFRAQPEAAAKTVALSKVDSWKRAEEFSKESVTLPGETYPSSALVAACYALLMAPKSAALQ